ncbi:MAG: hypothetical protein R3C05_19190 [Pirellulaceae bacterium]
MSTSQSSLMPTESSSPVRTPTPPIPDGPQAIDLQSTGVGVAQKLFCEGQSLLAFDPTMQPRVNLGTDRIMMPGRHLTTGDSVVYLNGGGTSIGGLSNGGTYFVTAVDANTIELSRQSRRCEDDLTSRGTGLMHGLERAAALIVSDAPVRGLSDGLTYFVNTR